MAESNTTDVNDDSPRDIQRTLDRLGVGLKKRWGQNFLIDRNARNRIIEALALDPSEREPPVWEIGPGLGAMTALLLERTARRVVAFELDRAFVRFLAERFESAGRLTVVAGDAYRTFAGVYAEQQPAAVLGNLPYSSAGRIIAALLAYGVECERMIFTTQRELADRLVAAPNSPSYSAFTVLCRIRAEIRRVRDLPGGCFYPAPRVSSSIVELRPRYGANPVADFEVLQELLRGAFAARRKTLRNSLAATRFARDLGRGALEELLCAAGGAPDRRPQELPPEVYRSLANLLAERTARVSTGRQRCRRRR